MSTPALFMKLDLGQNTVYTNVNKDRTECHHTLIVGDINNRYDKSNCIYLNSVPSNNVIKCQIYDKDTGLINTNTMNYILQLFIEETTD
jgi:hypothetical protein